MKYSELKKGGVYYRYASNEFDPSANAPRYRLETIVVTKLGKVRLTKTRLKKDGTHGTNDTHNFVPHGESYLYVSPAIARLALITSCSGNVESAKRRLAEAEENLRLAIALAVV